MRSFCNFKSRKSDSSLQHLSRKKRLKNIQESTLWCINSKVIKYRQSLFLVCFYVPSLHHFFSCFTLHLSYVQVILFEINCAIFYTNLHELFRQFISWTNWVNSGKFMDNCCISCQVTAGMKKVYNDLTIINLYYMY